MLKKLLFVVLLLQAPIVAEAQNAITIGETHTLGYLDNGNGNLLCAQNAYLSQTAEIQSLSLYVVTPSQQLQLGIYDATGPNGGPGKLRTQTASFTPKTGWNTANVASQIQLAPGTYWLAYLPQSNNLSFTKGLSTGISENNYSHSFGSLPATLSARSGSDPYHWSFYATLITVPAQPTLMLSFNPPNPSIASTAPDGTVVATIVPSWSNGNPFTGTLSFGSPYFSANGRFAISGSNLIVNPNGPGLAVDGNTTQNISIGATQ